MNLSKKRKRQAGYIWMVPMVGQTAAATKDAKYRAEPESKGVEHGGTVIADRMVGCLPMLLIAKPDRIVTRHNLWPNQPAIRNRRASAKQEEILFI
jgi:hypothetical protein